MTGPPSIPGAVVLISGDDHNGKSSLVDGFIHGKLTSNGYTPWRNLVADARLPMDEPLTFGRIDEDYGESESETFSLSSGWKDWNKVSETKLARGRDLRVNITFQDDTIGTCGEAQILRPLTYYASTVIALCFSIIHREALDCIPHRWIPELRHWVPNTPIVLIGTMIDLRDPLTNLSLTQKFGADEEPRRAVSTEEGKRMARQIGAVRYVECSASQNINVQETFAMLAMLAGEHLLLMRRKGTLRDKITSCVIV